MPRPCTYFAQAANVDHARIVNNMLSNHTVPRTAAKRTPSGWLLSGAAAPRTRPGLARGSAQRSRRVQPPLAQLQDRMPCYTLHALAVLHKDLRPLHAPFAAPSQIGRAVSARALSATVSGCTSMWSTARTRPSRSAGAPALCARRAAADRTATRKASNTSSGPWPSRQLARNCRTHHIS